LGENGKGEKVFILHIPMATKLGTFQWPPSLEHSNGHQAWNLPLATKLWILPLATKLWILPLATKLWILPLATKLWILPLATKLWIHLHIPFPSL
jgi:hypothetical protein